MDEDVIRKFKDFLQLQDEPPYTRTSYLNAQVDLISSDVRKKFYDFGPTTYLTDLYAVIGRPPYYFHGGAVYRPEDCERFLNELLPPKVSRVWKVLVVVLIFWPSALLWLICGHLVKSWYTFTLGLARRFYDRLGVFVFRGQ